MNVLHDDGPKKKTGARAQRAGTYSAAKPSIYIYSLLTSPQIVAVLCTVFIKAYHLRTCRTCHNRSHGDRSAARRAPGSPHIAEPRQQCP